MIYTLVPKLCLLNFRAYIFTVLVFIIGKEEKRGTNVRWGKKQIIYLSLHSHHQNDSCIKMGSDESHCNVSVGSDGQSHKTVSTDHNLFEEKVRLKSKVMSSNL